MKDLIIAVILVAILFVMVFFVSKPVIVNVYVTDNCCCDNNTKPLETPRTVYFGG